MFQCDSIRDAGKCYCNSHYPYSCDGEGRQADRQDDPGSHWAGSELALSQAWGEKRGASGRSGDTTGGIRWGVGGGAGSLTHRETHRGGHERKKGGMAQLFCSTGPCNQQQPESLIKYIKIIQNATCITCGYILPRHTQLTSKNEEQQTMLKVAL